jgi:hypothetical protein
MQRYSDRPIRFLGTRSAGDWHLKVYAIWCRGDHFDLSAFTNGILLAVRDLPEPAVTPQRPGAGFLICHRGRELHYVVLGWWDNENELSVRVFVRDGADWRAARSESFCVWDLQVFWHEREVYVRHVMGGAAAGSERYLDAGLDIY